MKLEADALRGAELYWVARGMVDFVVGAADKLPAWSPALVAPALTGLMCWGKPAGTVSYSAPGKSVDVPWMRCGGGPARTVCCSFKSRPG